VLSAPQPQADAPPACASRYMAHIAVLFGQLFLHTWCTLLLVRRVLHQKAATLQAHRLCIHPAAQAPIRNPPLSSTRPVARHTCQHQTHCCTLGCWPLQDTRLAAIRGLSRDFLESDWADPSAFRGCGPFVRDSWRIFCCGATDAKGEASGGGGGGGGGGGNCSDSVQI
jgi:hypothetical protein